MEKRMFGYGFVSQFVSVKCAHIHKDVYILFLIELTKTICIDQFTRYYNRTTGWDFVIITCDTNSGFFARSENEVNLDYRPSSCPVLQDGRGPYYCLTATRDRNCDGTSICRIEARFGRRWSYQNCYNSMTVEYECVKGEGCI